MSQSVITPTAHSKRNHLGVLSGIKEISRCRNGRDDLAAQRQTRYLINRGVIPVWRRGRLIESTEDLVREAYTHPDQPKQPENRDQLELPFDSA